MRRTHDSTVARVFGYEPFPKKFGCVAILFQYYFNYAYLENIVILVMSRTSLVMKYYYKALELALDSSTRARKLPISTQCFAKFSFT